MAACHHTWTITNGVTLTCIPPRFPMVCEKCGERVHMAHDELMAAYDEEIPARTPVGVYR